MTPEAYREYHRLCDVLQGLRAERRKAYDPIDIEYLDAEIEKVERWIFTIAHS
jgi:hypothetical protein